MKPAATRQGGITLLEVLITMSLVAFVLVSLGRLQAGLLLNHTLGRQQSLAVLLAEGGLARLRLSVASADAPRARREKLGPTKDCGEILAGQDTCYERRDHAVAAAAGLWRIESTVRWRDRHGTSRQVSLHSLAAAPDPAALAALYQPATPLLQTPRPRP